LNFAGSALAKSSKLPPRLPHFLCWLLSCCCRVLRPSM